MPSLIVSPRTTYSVARHGIKPGVDCTAQLNSLHELMATTGGVIEWGNANYRIDGPIVLPNDGGGAHVAGDGGADGRTDIDPRQPSIEWRGQGFWYDGDWILDPRNTTVLTFYTPGTEVARVLTKGFGRFKVCNLTLATGQTDASPAIPFILSTNTTTIVEKVGFRGFVRADSTLCDEDAVVYGGNDTVGLSTTWLKDSNDPNAAFQGYGSRTQDCYFQYCRRCVYLRNNANHVWVLNNSFAQSCGGESAIESNTFYVDVPANNVGCQIIGNLFEMHNYTYGIKLQNSTQFLMAGNGFYDTNTVTAYYRFENNAKYHTIIPGYDDGSKPLVSDATSGEFGTILGGQSDATTDPRYVYFAEDVRARNAFRAARNNIAALQQLALDGTTWVDLLKVTSQNHLEIKPGSGGRVYLLDGAGTAVFNAYTSGSAKRVQIDGEGVLYSATAGSVREGVKLGYDATKGMSFWGGRPTIQPAALTAADATVPSGTDAAIVANLQTRVNELEDRMRQMSILPSSGEAAPAAPTNAGTTPNGATGTSRTPTLDWAECERADYYAVYLSTNSSPPASSLVTNKPYGTTSYTPGSALSANTTYYWRIDAVNTNASVAASSVFSFTTGA